MCKANVLLGWVLSFLLTACGTAPSRPPLDAPGATAQPVPGGPLPELSPSVSPYTLSAEQGQNAAVHALGLVGTPYRYGGNTPDTGFDCSGLIAHVYRPQVRTSPPRMVAYLRSWGHEVPRDQMRTGDLVIFSKGSTPTHAGIYVGEGRFVHAPSTGGKVRLDHLEASYWARHQLAIRRP